MSPGDEERRPRPETEQQSSTTTTASLDALDTIHAAWTAGFNHGYAQGRQTASEDLARDWLHEEAARWTRQWVEDTTRLEKWRAGRAEREQALEAKYPPKPWPPEDPSSAPWVRNGFATEESQRRYHSRSGVAS
jgi:hypothetical protein